MHCHSQKQGNLHFRQTIELSYHTYIFIHFLSFSCVSWVLLFCLLVFYCYYFEDYASSSLRASSPGRSGGGAGKGRRAYNYVSEIWIPPPIPLWLSVDWAVRFPPISANVNKHKKRVPRVMTTLLMSSPPISISHRLFERCSCKLSFLFPPHSQSAPESLVVGYPNLRSGFFFFSGIIGRGHDLRLRLPQLQRSIFTISRVNYYPWHPWLLNIYFMCCGWWYSLCRLSISVPSPLIYWGL